MLTQLICFVYHFSQERSFEMEKQSVVLRVPKVLLSRVDKFKEERGFGTRTQAIFYLINYALEEIQRGDSSHD